MDKVKIQFKRNEFFKEMSYLVLMTGLWIAVPLLFGIDLLSNFFVCITWILFFLLVIICPLVLELIYYRYDKETTIDVDFENRQLNYNKNGTCKVVKFENIRTIDRYESMVLIFDIHYCKIITKDQGTIVVSSYLMRKAKAVIKKVTPPIPQDTFLIFFPILPHSDNEVEMQDI